MQGHRHPDLGSKLLQSVPTVHSLNRPCSRSSRLMVHAELSAKGKRHNAEAITVKRIMGEGSYGQVPTSCSAALLLACCRQPKSPLRLLIRAKSSPRPLPMASSSSAAVNRRACCAGL